MGRRPQLFPCVVFTVLAVVATCPVLAQELEPRAYRALPTELNFFVVAYSFSSGNVVMDPSVPLENLEAEIHGGPRLFTYVRALRSLRLDRGVGSIRLRERLGKARG